MRHFICKSYCGASAHIGQLHCTLMYCSVFDCRVNPFISGSLEITFSQHSIRRASPPLTVTTYCSSNSLWSSLIRRTAAYTWCSRRPDNTHIHTQHVSTKVSSLLLLNDLLSSCVIFVKAGLLFHCWWQTVEHGCLDYLQPTCYICIVEKNLIIGVVNITPSQLQSSDSLAVNELREKHGKSSSMFGMVPLPTLDKFEL